MNAIRKKKSAPCSEKIYIDISIYVYPLILWSSHFNVFVMAEIYYSWSIMEPVQIFLLLIYKFEKKIKGFQTWNWTLVKFLGGITELFRPSFSILSIKLGFKNTDQG